MGEIILIIILVVLVVALVLYIGDIPWPFLIAEEHAGTIESFDTTNLSGQQVRQLGSQGVHRPV